MKLNLKNRSRHLTGIAFFVFCIAANAGTYFQDFSTFSVGSTSFGDGSQLVSDHLGSVARIQDNTMRELTLTTGTNVRSAFKLPNLDGVPIVAFSAKWNSQIYGNAADMSEGLSFNFGQLNSLDLISTNYAQEAGYATGLCFSVRTATNNNPGFYLRLGTNTIASQPFNPVTQWGNFNSTRHFWEVDWHYSNGLTVRLDGTTIFTNISTAGFAPYADDRFAWAARTSSSSAEVRLDNIVVLTTGNLSPIAVSGPYTSSTNNGTASNAFDGNPATFWNGETNGWVEAGLATSGHQLWVFTITSANTADRTVDPKSWRIGARVRTSVIDGDVRVGAFLNPMETRAWMENWSIDDYSAYRISILTNNGHPSSTWIGDMHFYEYSPVSYSMNVATTPVLPVGTTISLSGTINPYNIPVNAIFEWGTTTNYGNTTPAQLIPGTNGNVTVNALLNFPEGVTYHYRLVGSNQLAVVTGTDATLQVIKPGVATTPITVKVVDNIRFRCVVDKKGLSFYTSTWFEWGLTTNYDHITPAQQVLAQGTSNEETITGLSPSATYHYRVAASNMVGITYGQDVAFQTVGSDISWTQANVESNWWQSIAISTDGTRMIAAGNLIIEGIGFLYISTNSGADWTRVANVPQGKWMAVASSSDGRNLLGVSQSFSYNSVNYPASYAVSTNAGATWRFASASGEQYCGASSAANGNFLCAVSSGSGSSGPGHFFLSKTNVVNPAGVGWGGFVPSTWHAVAMMSDGMKSVIAGDSGLYLFDSITLTTTQLTNAPALPYKSLAISANGTTIAAASHSTADLIYLSTNSGATWTTNFVMNSFVYDFDDFSSLSMSADGTRIVAAKQYSGVYLSMDSGATWRCLTTGLVGEQWKVALSADGGTIAAGGFGRYPGGIIALVAPIYIWRIPSLKTEVSGNQLAFSWTTNQTGFVLQSTTNLSTPNWTNTTDGIVITNGQYQFHLSPGSGSRFFRLTAPQ